MPRNIRALDGVRGLAIILVMLHHFERLIPANNPVLVCVKQVFGYGWSGVDLFFALSGFLITGILLDTRGADNYFRAFYARRMLRIFPLYYTVLIFILVILRPPVPLAGDRKLYFLYLTNWLVLWKGHWGPNVLGHFWSLAVEEQFYLIWPFCVWLLLPKHLIKLAIAGSVIALSARIFWVAHSGPSQAIVLSTVTRMDSLLCGALGAVLCRQPSTLPALRKWSPRIFILMVVVFAVGELVFFRRPDVSSHFTETLGFSLLAIGFAALVVHAAVSDDSTVAVQRVFRNGVLTEFGRYSYGIYVFHVPVLMICDALIYMRLPVSLTHNVSFCTAYVASLTVTSFVIARISYEYFERRFLALKRYFEPTYSRTVKHPIDVLAVPEL